MGLKLITEMTEEIGSFVVENTGGRKKYYIEGPFIQTEIVNRNKRKYLRSMMEQEVENYINEKVKTRQALGELNHPATPAINPRDACHLIESLTPHGNDWIGKAKVLAGGDFPMGNIVKGLIDEGVNFGVSTRGVGSLKTVNGITEVHNYKLATAADVVTDPSAPGAFVRGIMENVDWIYNATENEFVLQELDEVKQDLHENWKQFNQEKAIALFEHFIKTLR